MTSILVCGITSGDVTIHFTSSILKMQTELMRTPGVNISFEFFGTVDEALTHFHTNTKCDACVIIDEKLSVDPGFIFDNDASKQFTVASYPLRTVDWERVRAKIVDSREPAEHVGVTYNYDPTLATPEPGGTHVKIPAHSDVQLKIFKLTRTGLDSIIARNNDAVRGNDGRLALYSACIIDGKKLSPDQRLVHLWGEPIYADISRRTKNVGPYDFTGTVGNQRQLR
jgi:hypothetical protein